MRLRAINRTAFTLLEVILAIGLSAALMALLSIAIFTYLERLDISRSSVEQAQLARGVLRLIAADLRNTALLYEQDISSAKAAAASQALFDVDEADQEPPVEEETTESERPLVGINGDAATIQVDVLRIRPSYRVDPDAPDRPIAMTYGSPGITSVRYLLSEEGLVRQEASRDVAIQQELQGLQDAWEKSTRVVASEVVDLRFRYHDGSQSLEFWDLEEQQGATPLAIEVRIGLRTQTDDKASGATSDGFEAGVRYYRFTVRIPQSPGAGVSAEESEETEGAL